MTQNFNIKSKICKVDDDLGLVFGFAMICKIDGEPYFDSQDDHILEAAMVRASLDFMLNSRVAGEMHTKAEGGSIVFAMPLTEDIAKAFNLTTEMTGLMIAMKPDNEETLKKFRDGTYTGFSIGGERITDEEVSDG